MTKWSGLGPAVNSHLARWARVDRELQTLNRLRQQPDASRLIVSGSQHPIMASWAIFARTWGCPQPDGTISHSVVPMDGATINGREQFDHDETTSMVGVKLMDFEHQMLRKAETIYVSAPVMEQVTYSASQMEPEKLFHTDMIAPYGLAIFETPMYVHDLHPETGAITDFLRVGIRAIGWLPADVASYSDTQGDYDITTAKPGIMLYSYTTTDDWMSSYRADLVHALRTGKIDLTDIDTRLVGDLALEEAIEAVSTAGPPRGALGVPRDLLWPSDVMPWRYNTPWEVNPDPYVRAGKIDSVVAYSRRWFLTLMRFAWQRIVVAHREPLTKKAQKRIEGYGRNRPRNDYSVLRLRRVEGTKDYEEGTGQPLAYRRFTRGHWRRVYYPSLGNARNPDGSFNDDSHRLKWIYEYFSGPEDGEIGPLHKGTVIVR